MHFVGCWYGQEPIKNNNALKTFSFAPNFVDALAMFASVKAQKPMDGAENGVEQQQTGQKCHHHLCSSPMAIGETAEKTIMEFGNLH